MVNSAMQNKKIEKGKDGVLTEEEVLQVLTKEAKKRKESVLAFENGGRPELAENEKKELALIEKYLPAQMSDEELSRLIDKHISALNASAMADMGKVIGAVKAEAGAAADGATVARLVKEKLQ